MNRLVSCILTYLKKKDNITIGKNSSFVQPSYISAINGTVVIGDNISCNSNVTIDASEDGGKIIIGNNVMIGQNTVIRSSNHRFDRMDIPIRYQGHVGSTITIEDSVWIGANCVILSGVIIGKHSVIGAGSIVTKSIPEYSIAVGNPARVIRRRT